MNSQAILCACGCGKEIAAVDKNRRPRRFVFGHSSRGLRASPETRARLSASHIGNRHTAETRARMSASRMGKRVGPDNPLWKGGRYFVSGYVLVWAPEHPRAHPNGYVREHILIYEAAHGPTPKGHVIHHKNGTRQDNRLENLQMMTRSEHRRLHALARIEKERA